MSEESIKPKPLSSGDKMTIKAPEYNFRINEFAIINKDRQTGIPVAGDFMKCRDSFHYRNASIKSFLFSHKVGTGENVFQFVWKFEKEMDHQKLSLFGPTNFNRISWVIPAKFWWRNTLRRSLFTALLRVGIQYEVSKDGKDNFDYLINNGKYFRSTKEGVKWFIKGNTWATKRINHNVGWVEIVSGLKTEKDLKEVLTEKPITENELMDFALKQLGKNKDLLISEYRSRRKNRNIENKIANIAKME